MLNMYCTEIIRYVFTVINTHTMCFLVCSLKLFYTCMYSLGNSRFKSSQELMLCVIDISTLNKTYLI